MLRRKKHDVNCEEEEEEFKKERKLNKYLDSSYYV